MSVMTTTAGARGWAAADLGAVIRSVTAAVAREIRVRWDTNYLMEQSDRMLSDIGLSRDEVMRAARVMRGGWGRPGEWYSRPFPQSGPRKDPHHGH